MEECQKWNRGKVFFLGQNPKTLKPLDPKMELGWNFPRTFIALFRAGKTRHAQLVLEQYLRSVDFELEEAQEFIELLPWTADFEMFYTEFGLLWQRRWDKLSAAGWSSQ